ncbi:MAG: hypothetical protein NVS9B4_00610 [Candidatus Acidiferrum sp.]
MRTIVIHLKGRDEPLRFACTRIVLDPQWLTIEGPREFLARISRTSIAAYYMTDIVPPADDPKRVPLPS